MAWCMACDKHARLRLFKSKYFYYTLNVPCLCNLLIWFFLKIYGSLSMNIIVDTQFLQLPSARNVLTLFWNIPYCSYSFSLEFEKVACFEALQEFLKTQNLELLKIDACHSTETTRFHGSKIQRFQGIKATSV